MTGIKEWVIQRATSIVLLIYLVVFFVVLMMHQTGDVAAWRAIFHPVWFKIFSVLAFSSVVTHAWIGVWTIFTDYVHPWRLRLVLAWVAVLALLSYFIWFLQILWGV